MIRLEPLVTERGWTVLENGAPMGKITPAAWSPKLKSTAALREMCDRIDEETELEKARRQR